MMRSKYAREMIVETVYSLDVSSTNGKQIVNEGLGCKGEMLKEVIVRWEVGDSGGRREVEVGERSRSRGRGRSGFVKKMSVEVEEMS